MNKPPVEPRFECTNLHTGEKHRLTQDEVGELLETGVAPTPTIVPTPESRERVVTADTETANRLCVPVIRADKNGNEINYGRLAVGHLNGIPFVAQVEKLISMGLPCIYVQRIPKFVDDISLEVRWKDESAPGGHPRSGEREATIYALEKEDLAPLGLALSKNDCTVMVYHRGCYLQVWESGKATSERKTIDAFYLGLTPEEIEYSKF